MRARLRWWAARASDARDEIRARPLHTLMAGFVAGLLAGPRSPALVGAAAAAAIATSGRRALSLGATAAVVVGALTATARIQTLDHTRLRARFGHALVARVTLLEAPRRRAYDARTAIAQMHGEHVLLRASARVAWPVAPIGAIVQVRGALAHLSAADAWLRPRNVHAVLRADAITPTGAARGGLVGAVDAIRRRADLALTAGLPPPQAALLRGMALGEDEALPEATRTQFQAAGLSHLVAASGQNVMLLAALVIGICAVAGIGLRIRLALVMVAIAGYVPLAGGGPSIQRAGVMGAAGIVALLTGRPAARWYALLLAAAVTLVANPRSAQEPGWQLSFAAVVAILTLAPRVAESLRRRGLPARAADAVALTVAATVGTAPLIALLFDQTSLVSLPANVLAEPAVAPVMWLGMLASALGQFAPGPASVCTALAGFPLAYIAWVADTAASMPFAQVAAPPAIVCATAATAWAAIASSRVRAAVLGAWGPGARWAAFAAALALGVAVALAWRQHAIGPPTAPAGARISFLDIGQGDATLLQDHGAAVLVDTGPPGGPILARLRSAGVRRLDALVITHAQADHDGGAAGVLRAMPIGMVLDGRDGVVEPEGQRLAAEAATKRVRRVTPDAGEVLRAGPLRIRILSPRADAPTTAMTGADPNQRAVVAVADVGQMHVLLTADAESDVLDRLDLGQVDILKVSHHGSADAGLPALLERLHPRLAAIEVGAHNTYGHPVPSTVDALRAAGAAVYRTDLDGTIRVTADHGALLVQTNAG